MVYHLYFESAETQNSIGYLYKRSEGEERLTAVFGYCNGGIVDIQKIKKRNGKKICLSEFTDIKIRSGVTKDVVFKSSPCSVDEESGDNSKSTGCSLYA